MNILNVTPCDRQCYPGLSKPDTHIYIQLQKVFFILCMRIKRSFEEHLKKLLGNKKMFFSFLSLSFAKESEER